MTPKIIHYCWFGGNPLPDSAKACIASWREKLPDYEIKEWNESNFDVYGNADVEEAYRLKKYAFVSDYARFLVLYKYGGIYFDIDVEVLKPLDDIVARGPFMGQEDMSGTDIGFMVVASGLGMGSCAGQPLLKKVIDRYNNMHYVTALGKTTGTTVAITTKIMEAEGYETLDNGLLKCCGVYIYPIDYFDPMNFQTREVHITENTRTFHHYAESWVTRNPSFFMKLRNKLKRIYVHHFVALRRALK